MAESTFETHVKHILAKSWSARLAETVGTRCGAWSCRTQRSEPPRQSEQQHAAARGSTTMARRAGGARAARGRRVTRGKSPRTRLVAALFSG
jgi:hypothetical protein